MQDAPQLEDLGHLDIWPLHLRHLLHQAFPAHCAMLENTVSCGSALRRNIQRTAGVSCSPLLKLLDSIGAQHVALVLDCGLQGWLHAVRVHALQLSKPMCIGPT